MSRRMNIATPRPKKDGGTYWVNIGTAWFNDNGGIQLVFDALPIPDGEGRVVANLFEPREKNDGPRRPVSHDPAMSGAGGTYGENIDEDRPF